MWRKVSSFLPPGTPKFANEDLLDSPPHWLHMCSYLSPAFVAGVCLPVLASSTTSSIARAVE